MATDRKSRRLPPWFKIRLATNGRFVMVRNRIRSSALHTVCESASCPNQVECWNAGTATFLILGDRCMRHCGFCGVPKGVPAGTDREEPQRVAEAVSALKLRYAVVTSVTRDDLPDGGAAIFAETIRAIRRASPGCRVEVLIPDFQGDADALDAVLAASPDVLNHNIETVPRLYPRVRPAADYRRSLVLLQRAKERGFVTKSGMMLGLGEEAEDVRGTMIHLRDAGCDILTLGQYLQPRKDLLTVARFYHPDEFQELERQGRALGFRSVHAGPKVRSSYHADRR